MPDATAPISSFATLARRPGLVAVTVAGTLVIHDPFEDRYVRLSASAAVLWERLARPATTADLAEALVSRYGIDAGRARQDAETLAGSLIERGLLTVEPGTA
jgi:hypothetical protein